MRKIITAGICALAIGGFGFSIASADTVAYDNNPDNFTAGSLAVGDTLKFLDTGNNDASHGGGEFGLYGVDSSGSYSFLYQSFCLERNEYISYGKEYTIASISDSAELGGLGTAGAPNSHDVDGTAGSDPLSGYTRFLYHEFFYGTLDGYAYDDGITGSSSTTMTNDESAAMLQAALWYFENEIDEQTLISWSGGDNYFVSLAYSVMGTLDGSQPSYSDVKVINIVDANGNLAQSQFYIDPSSANVPEPATMALFGFGLIGLAGVARKRAKKGK